MAEIKDRGQKGSSFDPQIYTRFIEIIAISNSQIRVLVILCFTAIQSSRTRSVENAFSPVDSGPSKTSEKDKHINKNNDIPRLLEMEGGGVSTTPPVIIPIELEESGLNRKVLGLPGWEYFMVSLVVVAAVGVGGSVAIVCKKCCGIAGRGVTGKSENHGEGQIGTSS